MDFFLRKSTVFFHNENKKLIHAGNTHFWKSRAWFQTKGRFFLRAGDCERALFSPCSHLSSVMVQNSHTCEGDMMKENNIRTSEANRKTS